MASLTENAPADDGPVHTGKMFKEGHDVRAMLGMGDWKERFFVLFYSEEFGYDLLYYKEEANFEVRVFFTSSAHAWTLLSTHIIVLINRNYHREALCSLSKFSVSIVAIFLCLRRTPSRRAPSPSSAQKLKK